MIYHGNVNLGADPVVAVQLATTRTPASWVTIQIKRSAVGAIWVGNKPDDGNVANGRLVQNETGATGGGFRLSNSGDRFCNLREMGGPTAYDLQHLYIVGENASEGVTFIFGRR